MEISMGLNEEQFKSFSADICPNLKTLTPGQIIDIDNCPNIKLEILTEHRAVDAPTILNLILDTAVNMEVGLLTTWLYDKCKATGVNKIEIDNEEIKIDTKEIRTKLSEVLEHLDK